jgi:hypothetical protein
MIDAALAGALIPAAVTELCCFSGKEPSCDFGVPQVQ